jgi:site-specific recombinase XerD
MPHVKAQWKEEEHIIRDTDMDNMLEVLENYRKTNSALEYRSSDQDGQQRVKHLRVDYDMVKCMLCLLYVFGRRLSGILRLRRSDFWTKRGYLYVRFMVLKKSRRVEGLKPKTRVKRVNIKKQTKYVQHIITYVSRLQTENAPLFPGYSQPHTKIVKRRDAAGQVLKVYKYEATSEGIMSRQQAYKIIKAINPNVYPHWFRHSLATQLAEEGIDQWQLMNWFDWDRFATAKRYVTGTAAMTRDISNREVG